ncbi:hypothetical protein MCOR03_007666 [Pyricularia oryzae]|nr:hypothetical protein MCOR19_005167 [Pyricularia oryzae]KAI6364273.1 hypothetical protein MCOR32_007964 [Pyricularia oryzae]KAI6490162.1 hypothetical protein MCOR18_002453 [Pyricularia oryzae]KAI6503897.1 hypothetical protein MCOR11_000362 [Pyricularia oryzae]KAI6516457.1 hypothetical protein MCOR10_007700 [Pyricularia oryzae]
MIPSRRHVSKVVIQWPRPQPRIPKTLPLSRGFYGAAAGKQNNTGDDASPPRSFIYATETPLAEQLDSLGVYRRGIAWVGDMRKRWIAAEAAKKAAVEAAKESVPEAGKEVDVEQKGRCRATHGLTRLRKLVAAVSPEEKEKIWETIFDAERVFQIKKEKTAKRRQISEGVPELFDDRPPQAAKIAHEALKLYEENKFTEAERLRLEAELSLIPLHRPIGRGKVAVEAEKVKKAKKRAFDKSELTKILKSGDKTRIHVVNEKLCDDVLKSIPSSLERHKGCDIIDLYPGTGLFSRKLNDLLQPRSHILLEPEPQIYQEFLEPILQRPGSRLVPKSGLVWQELNTVLTPEFLPHQEIHKQTLGQAPTRNDTLLVVANLGFYPNRSYMNFKSIVSMVTFQLIQAIRLRNVFQKYGLVRMLLWLRPPELDSILPKDLTGRRRPAAEAELVTEHIAEICTSEERMERHPGYNRHATLELHSCRRVLDRMRRLGLELPEGRETSRFMRHVLEAEAAGQELPKLGLIPDEKTPHKSPGEKRVEAEDRSIQATWNFDKGISAWAKTRQVHGWELSNIRQEAKALWIDVHEKQNLAKSGNSDPALLKEIERLQGLFDKKAKEWNEKFARFSYGRSGMHKVSDDYDTFHSDPPLLMWDRREVEPFLVRPEEFYPNIPLSFVDIQPKAANPMLLENGPGSSRHGDNFDIMLKALFHQRSKPVAKPLSEMAHGALDGMNLESIESLKDPRVGGAFMKGHDEVRPIKMNERQFLDLLVAWMRWPFRPSYTELVTMRRGDPQEDED